MRDFIFELGCEDLPAKQISAALAFLKAQFCEKLDTLKIAHGEVKAYATPRRLALVVEELSEKQSDGEETRVGPAKSACYDAEGRLTRAAEGFLKSCGAAASDIFEIEQEKKKGKSALYIAVKISRVGADTATLLPDLIVDILRHIPWKKPMRWSSCPQAFARPVHWLLCLFGGKVLPLHFAGIDASDKTYGHRFMSPGAVTLSSAKDYVGALRKAFVLVDAEERRAKTLSEAAAAAEAVGGILSENESLTDEVVNILEWPVGITGSFENAFLKLPRQVLETTMVINQRYYSVVDKDGRLLPHFVTLSNTEVADKSVVARGNNRVLKARLKDAEFFFAEDQKRNAEFYNDKLTRIRYIEGLGTLWHKVERIESLSASIASIWGDDVRIDLIDLSRAAHLCKTDLATGMVGEFPELQGFMGKVYASASGEKAVVANAIDEHYMPRYAGDAVAPSTIGAIIGIADKMDTIASLFCLGRVPTGAADPFALRRCAVGIIRTLIEHKRNIALGLLIERAVEGVGHTVGALSRVKQTAPIEDANKVCYNISQFLKTRLRYWLCDSFAAESVDSVLEVSTIANLPSVLGRVEAIDSLRKEEFFSDVLQTLKRISNIVHRDDVEIKDIDEKYFEVDEERLFYDKIRDIEKKFARRFEEGDYKGALTLLCELKAPADAFFDAVLVNCDAPDVRANRYALLDSAESIFTAFADFRKM